MILIVIESGAKFLTSFCTLSGIPWYIVVPPWRCDDLNRHRIRSQVLDLLLHSLGDSLVHRGTSRHHHVSVQILPDVDITLHDRREGQFVDSLLFQSQELWLEQCLRCSESLRSHSDHLTIG